MLDICETIEKMQDFLLNEPSEDFSLLDHSIHIVKYNGLDEHDLKEIAKVANSLDHSGKLALIRLAYLCRKQVENTVAMVVDFIRKPCMIDKYRDILALAESDFVKSCRKELVDILSVAIGSIAKQKAIGDSSDIDSCLDYALDAIFSELEKLKFEVYENSGLPVGNIGTTATSVQVSNSLAECLIRLEQSKDGIYICYISNPGTLDGWFGFFVKSNGNLFSYNERIDEAYIGQHGNMRNGRYAEYSKAYDLFPYELCEFSEETDYKGYSTEVKIGENRNLFEGDNLKLAIRTILTMMLLVQKHCGKKIKGKPVIVNSLLEKNITSIENGKSDSKALVVWKGSSIVKATSSFAIPHFNDAKFVRGEYDKEFNHASGGRLETGVFTGINQDIVDAYGDDFHINHDKILASDSSRRLIGCGECEQEFVGSPERLRLQAYYEARKQLAKHIWIKLKKEFDEFGGREGLQNWFKDRLIERKDLVLNYCIDAFLKKGRKEGDVEFGKEEKQPGASSLRFAAVQQPFEISIVNKPCFLNISLSEYKYGVYTCAVTGAKASWFFRFSFYTYKQVIKFLGCPLPKFCTGWRTDRFYNGNSILDVTDPVGDIRHPLGDGYIFNFGLGLSKRALARLEKNHVPVSEIWTRPEVNEDYVKLMEQLYPKSTER